ncbi:hypothetical protein PRABACTJOHN_03317 [Parabacteroides johnsonii DSM 18315]|uniref:Uncharacterized protein n=1 Tax=Parabacteroides johnsonii DSM 18315 TaxID=537006 RepID=B7BE40_9BACT|nr:hypothetical protein PRABACTJOHN_03317 [Parabacteroides johnsonii DSM 18315]
MKQSLSIAVAKVTTFLKPPNCNSTFLHKNGHLLSRSGRF